MKHLVYTFAPLVLYYHNYLFHGENKQKAIPKNGRHDIEKRLSVTCSYSMYISLRKSTFLCQEGSFEDVLKLVLIVAFCVDASQALPISIEH